MNSRERMLLILVGLAAGLLVVKVVAGRYFAALKWYDTQIVQLKRDLEKAETERTLAGIVQREWLDAGSQTLSMDSNEATTLWRGELEKLGAQCGFPVEVTLESTPKRWLRNGVRTLNASITGQGRIDDIANFMLELHRLPYAVRVKSLTLDQVNKPTRRDDKSQKPGVLKLTAYVDTLLLPSCELVPQIRPATLDPAERKPTSRPEGTSLADYQPWLEKKLFQPWEPPPVIVRRQDPRPQSVPAPPEPHRVPKVEPPPPPPRDAAFVLGRLLSSPRGQLAVLENPAQPGLDEYKAVGDAMYNGTLVYVNPDGAVTAEKDGRLWFHPLGEPLQNCAPLMEQSQPMVYQEVMKLKLARQETGISEGSQ